MLVFSIVGSLRCLVRPDEAGHGFVDGNDGGGTVAAKMAELDGLEAHVDFLIYSMPEKAFWLSELKASFDVFSDSISRALIQPKLSTKSIHSS